MALSGARCVIFTFLTVLFTLIAFSEDRDYPGTRGWRDGSSRNAKDVSVWGTRGTEAETGVLMWGRDSFLRRRPGPAGITWQKRQMASGHSLAPPAGTFHAAIANKTEPF